MLPSSCETFSVVTFFFGDLISSPKHTNTLIQTKVIFISAKTNLWLKEVKQLSITVVFFLKFHLII